MPNVSASLSDKAYAIWKDIPGKRSPWISRLIEEGDIIMAKNEALDLRVGHLLTLLSNIMWELNTSKQGCSDEEWAERTVLIWNECLEALEGTIHFHTLGVDYRN